MTKDELLNIQLLGSYVLVETDNKLNEEITTKGGLIMWIDTSYAPELHTSLVVEVIKVPQKLTNMPWETEMDIQEGDTLWCDWDEIIKAFNDPSKVFEVEDKYCLLLRYQKLFVAKRYVSLSAQQINNYYDSNGWPEVLSGNKNFIFIMLNGYILLDQIKESELPYGIRPKQYKTSQEIPKNVLKKISREYCRIGFIGKPEYYLNKNKEIIDIYGSCEPKPRDIVKMANPHYCQPFEQELHASLDNGRVFFIAQRKHIAGIIE